MRGFSRVLAALDGSSRAPGVFEVAANLAERLGARLYLFHAIFVPPEFPAAAAGGTGVDGDPLVGHLGEQAWRRMRTLAEARPGVAVEEYLLGSGQPWRAILECADRIDADLIVIGSHGYSRVERMLGTTAAILANRSQRSVLVVHEKPTCPI